MEILYKKENYILAKKVFIDPGHGGNDSGAVGINNLLEKDITLSVAKKVYDFLKKQGLEIKLSRTDDKTLSLKDRTSAANSWKADCFISIHCNAAGADGKWHTASGWSVFISQNASQNSKKLAKTLYDEALLLNLKGNRAIPKEHYWVQNLAMCRDTICPAVLTENLFQDNKDDVNFLLSEKGKQAIVDAHYNGIIKYLG